MSIHSTLTIATTDPQRIIKRLSNHWRHKMNISETDGNTLIPFSDTDQAVLSANDETLIVHLTTNDQDAHNKLQSVIVNHINRMAGQVFDDVIWQPTTH